MSSDVPMPKDVRMHGFSQRVEVETGSPNDLRHRRGKWRRCVGRTREYGWCRPCLIRAERATAIIIGVEVVTAQVRGASQ